MQHKIVRCAGLVVVCTILSGCVEGVGELIGKPVDGSNFEAPGSIEDPQSVPLIASNSNEPDLGGALPGKLPESGDLPIQPPLDNGALPGTLPSQQNPQTQFPLVVSPNIDPPPLSYSDPSVVTVDPLTAQYLGDVSALDRSKFLNLHDTHLDDSKTPRSTIESYIHDLEAGHGRMFLSPMSFAKQEIATSGYPSTATAMLDGPTKVLQYHSNPLKYLSDANRMVITDHPNAVMTLGNDPIQGARWAADYFTYYFDDDSRPHFYEPLNEPFARAGEFVNQYGGSEEQTRLAMTRWIAEIGKEFDTRPELQDVNIIGYASSWPSMERFDFGHWDSRMKMFIDNAGEHVDSFSVHLYDGMNAQGVETERSGSNSQAILDLIETYSMKVTGEVKPHSITEYGNVVDRPNGDKHYVPAVNSQSIKSFNYIMMELMEREDRILHSIPFITGYSADHWTDPARGDGNPHNSAMWRPNPDNIQLFNGRWEFIDDYASDNYLINSNHLFFKFWKGVKGTRARVHVNDADLQVAAFIDTDTAHIVIGNLEAGTKIFRLDIAEMLGYNFRSVKTERLHVPLQAGATLTSESIDVYKEVDGTAKDFGNIVLKDNEFIRLTVKFDRTIVAKDTARRLSYYSDDYLQSILAFATMRFNFSGITIDTDDLANSNASLRMSLGRDHDRSKKPKVKINGVEVEVPNDWPGYDQKTRVSFFGAISIPFDYALLRPNTTVEVTFPDSGGHVSSIVMDVNSIAK